MAIPNPLYRENVFTFKNLPIEEKQRQWTDCCCTILTALFALALFITSFFMFTPRTYLCDLAISVDNYYKVNFPADDSGMTCYNDLREQPYVFFADPSDPTAGRYCVSECPKRGDTISCLMSNATNCRPRSSTYDTRAEVNKIGAMCVPKNQELNRELFSHPQLGNKLSLTHGYDMIRFALLAGGLIGLIYMALMGCLSKIMTYVVFILAFLTLVAVGLYILLRPVYLFKQFWVTIVLAVVLFLVAIAFVLFIVCYKKQIELTSVFMKHSNQFLKETFAVYLYIPLFILLTVGLLVLITWQFIAFGTANRPYYNKRDIYYHSNHVIFLQVLNIIELVWGLQFLRDAFNFVVSGNAVEWYFREYKPHSKHCCKPFSRLLCKHWGSVVGGSFMNAFFKLFDMFADCFNCDPRGKCGKCQTIYEKLCCCNYIFELIRTDAYAYINLTGIPYCNSARQCEALCKYSDLIRSSHSCTRLYRNAAHTFAVGLAALLAYVIFDDRTNIFGNYDHFWIAAGVVFAAYSIATYFLDIHPNGVEGIAVSYLTEENCEGEQFIEVCPGELRRDLYNYKSRYLAEFEKI